MFYVTMTDTFMSGWGLAKGKTNKLIFECETLEEAKIVAYNAHNRTDQKRINICGTKPYYDKNRYYPQYITKKEYPSWYIKDYFYNIRIEREIEQHKTR